MAGFQSFSTVALAGLLLSACTAMTPPVDVTRFHNAELAPITPGSVVIRANVTDEGPSRSIEYAT
jgi:PBP1b-binding outer membrane lipoprotein LpoB